MQETRQPFPNRNNPLKQSVESWIEDKQEIDSKLMGLKPNLWGYKGKLYDLTKFINEHPGGKYFLEITKGTDITDLVITHHFNEPQIEKILDKYYKEDSKISNIKYRFDWDDKNSTYYSLKNQINQTIAKDKLKATLSTKIQYIFLLVIWINVFIYFALNQTLLNAMISGFFLLSLVGVGHNFVHQKPSLFRFYMDFSLFGSKEWIVSHAISHHTYSNLDIDVEISAFEPFIYYLSNKPKNHWISVILSHILFFFIGFLNYIRRFILIIFGKSKLEKENFIPIVQLLILFYLSSSYLNSFYLWFVMHALNSFHLLAATFPNHRTSIHWSEGDPSPLFDFAEHTIMTSSDHSVDLPLILAFIMFGGFNEHIGHHIFPTLDRSVLKELRTIIRGNGKQDAIPKSFFDNLFKVYVAFFRDKPYYNNKKIN